MAVTEGGQPAAKCTLEDALDADVSGGGERRRGESVARGKAVLHPLDHGLELRRHEAARLGGANPEGVFEFAGVQPVKGACRGRGGQRPKDHARMPAPRDHVEAAERKTDTRPGLVAEDRSEKEPGARDRPYVRRCREHCWEHQRVGVERSERVVIVELETLDEARVEHRGGRGTGRAAAPADKSAAPGVVEGRDALDADARDRKLGADEGTSDAVEHQVLGVLADGGGNIVQCGGREPGCEPAGWSFGVSSRAGPGVLRLFGDGHGNILSASLDATGR